MNELLIWLILSVVTAVAVIFYVLADGNCKVTNAKTGETGRNVREGWTEEKRPYGSMFTYVDNRQVNILMVLNQGDKNDPRLIDLGDKESVHLPRYAHPLFVPPMNN